MDGYIGEIRIFGGNYAPKNWAFCHGQTVKISDYTTLFAVIGTLYGGDGRTTLALPDFRSRTPFCVGTGPGLRPYVIGQRGGVEEVQLNTTEIPSHSHNAIAEIKIPCNKGNGSVDTPVNSFQAVDTGRPKEFSDTSDSYMASFDNDVTVDKSGGNQPHYNIPPYIGMHYIICLEGLYPERS